MKLEIGTFYVNDVISSNVTSYENETLKLNIEEILKEILSDRAIINASIEIAKPGDSTRIVGYRDIIEPRIKISGKGVCYPGVCNRSAETVGSGTTFRLDGVGVVNLSDLSPTPKKNNSNNSKDNNINGINSGFDILYDMSGPSADIIPYSKIINVCLITNTDPDLSIEKRNWASQEATLKLSDIISKTVIEKKPDEIEIFNSPESVNPDLPKVVYISCHNSPEHFSHSVSAFGTGIYGLTRLNAPWLLNPNEWFDGAVAGGNNVSTSWLLVNNPVIKDLYRRHGKEINFVGCIAIRTRWSHQTEKNITSNQAAKIASQIGAEGAIITWDNGGNDFMEVIRTVKACEDSKIKTVFITFEEHPDTGSPLLETLPEARAIVSTGWGRNELMPIDSIPEYDLKLPQVNTVIGKKSIFANQNALSGTIDARSELRTYLWNDRYGVNKWSAFDY